MASCFSKAGTAILGWLLLCLLEGCVAPMAQPLSIITETTAPALAQSATLTPFPTSPPSVSPTMLPTSTVAPSSTSPPAAMASSTLTPTGVPTYSSTAISKRRPPSGRIVFVVDGQSLYTINADGSALTQLIDKPANIFATPIWSSDGRRIFFLSDLAGAHGILSIYSLNTATRALSRLTNDSYPNDEIALSPQGDRIAYRSERDVRDEIYILDLTSGGLHLLVKDELSRKWEPSWSPSGQQIAFLARHNNDHYNDLYVVASDGSHEVRVASAPIVRGRPAWSPDGTRLAVTVVQDGKYDIYVARSDGSDLSPLTRDGTGGFSLAWSPDGSQIVFEKADGIYSVWVSDGRQAELTPEPTVRNPITMEPLWSPDGTHIAFVSQRDGGDAERQELYVMNSDGSQVTRLTFNVGLAYVDSIAWHVP
jgi:Tol biopolymer transport system component